MITRRFRAVSLLAAVTTLLAVVGVMAAGSASANLNGGCNPSIENFKTSDRVGVTTAVNGNDVTYTFDSFVTEGSGGIPGLIAYCVYSDSPPDSATVVATGADSSLWVDPGYVGRWSFERPGGDPTNIPYDGASHEMGTATWNSGVSANFDRILLHINDPAECDRLYGGNPLTCFVLPGGGGGGQGGDLQVSKDATPSFTRTFHWDISKDVDKTEIHIADGGTATFNYTVNVTHDNGTDSGWAVSGTIHVHNPNLTKTATGVSVSDAVDNGGSCTVDSSNLVNGEIAGGATVDFPYSCTYSSAPSPDAGTNTATASWDQASLNSPDSSADGTASFDFGAVSPTIVNGSVDVSDTFGGSLGTVSYTDPSPTSFPYSHDFSGVGGTCTDYTNTASLSTGESDSKTVTVCVGLDLTVSKDATPSYKRTYAWTISKNVDKTLVEQVGGQATFNYTVHVAETGFTDSDIKATGTITVTNPNDWESITFDLADAVDNSGSCSIGGGGSGLSVAALSTKTANYTCTYSSVPSDGTNTATATWDKDAYSTPSGTASGTAGVAFGDPTTTVNKTIHVTDSLGGNLGSLTATDSAPFASADFHYSNTVNVPANNCIFINNTAIIVETGQSDSKTVEVCGPAKTGALTMGFWQNKNGQGIIASYGGTNCQALRTWLNGYNPFADLTANTCSGVQTYVTNVIKAANAGGATMNAMLKAQMLATALDVYFSDPALGGNRINAPAPIGGVTIDLTKICRMIDSSGGTATCSGVYDNASSAFGGATSLTVSQILAYAASQSNSGGSNWYGQVKATQGLAKNTFDAINNQVAFSP